MRAGELLALAALGGAVIARRAGQGLVAHRERAAGVLPRLQALLDDWELEGTHRIVVAPDGGLRTDADAQARYAQQGNSNAATLEDTPHGRGAAIDVYPEDFIAHIAGPWEAVPEPIKRQFAIFGRFAEARGLKWGGRWRGATFPNGDQPHVELPNWRQLPYPPEEP